MYIYIYIFNKLALQIIKYFTASQTTEFLSISDSFWLNPSLQLTN